MGDNKEFELTQEKVDLLKHIEQNQREDLKYHRDFQYKIFVWASNVLIVFIGALLITKPNESFVWTVYGFMGRLIASLSVVAVVVFSVKWQDRHRKWHQEHREVISKIDHYLHCFEKGYFAPSDKGCLFPERWDDSPQKTDLSILKRAGRINYISAILFLGILAILMVWFS